MIYRTCVGLVQFTKSNLALFLVQTFLFGWISDFSVFFRLQLDFRPLFGGMRGIGIQTVFFQICGVCFENLIFFNVYLLA